MGLKEFLHNRRTIKFKKKYKVGLCLSGGGTRGFAHLGAFKAFEECGIKFDAVAGTSIGSVFAAFYASQMPLDDIYKFSQNVKNKDFVQQRFGIFPSKMDNFAELLTNVMPYKKIEEFKIPFYCVSVDLRTGKEIIFSSGSVVPALTASCAIPGVFLPVKYKNMTLIDGGVKNNIPADVLRLNGCDFVVTIDCNPTRGGGTDSNKMLTQFITSIGIMMVNNSRKGLNCSDIVVSPDMKKFKMLDISSKDEMIDVGYKATMELMPEIKKLFEGKYKKK